MDIKHLSNQFNVELLSDKDIPAILKLSQGNPKYFYHCPPAVSPESIKADIYALPDGKNREDKYYIGFREKSGNGNSDLPQTLVAVMDLILKYPDDRTAFIGFFMVDASVQGKGVGSAIVEEVCSCLKSQYDFVRLGYVRGNAQAENFWLKNEFKPTGIISQKAEYDIVYAQRSIGSTSSSSSAFGNNFRIIDVRQRPNLIEAAANWFHEKWEVPLQAYMDSMEECLASDTGVPAWYIVKDESDNIIAGLGIIENDFHKRPDLRPNICALYVEAKYRKHGIALMLLNHACAELAKKGIADAYLITTHTAFYERCGWDFCEMIEEDDGNMIRCYHRRTD